MQSERNEILRSIVSIILFTLNSQKCKLMFSDRKQVDCYLETEMRREGWIVKQQEETFVDNRYIYYVHYDGFMSINVCQNSSRCHV